MEETDDAFRAMLPLFDAHADPAVAAEVRARYSKESREHALAWARREVIVVQDQQDSARRDLRSLLEQVELGQVDRATVEEDIQRFGGVVRESTDTLERLATLRARLDLECKCGLLDRDCRR